MMAFLRVADSMEESDPELKVWVKQVRDAAYDTEDVLEKFKLNFTHNHGTRFHGFVRKISFSIKTLKARYQIAYEVQRIKNRVINISMEHQRYHDKYGILEQGSKSIGVNNAWYDCRGDALLLEEAELVGIEKPKTKLIGWLVEGDPRLKVISVVGMEGLGKTTLVKKVYNDAAIKKHFHIRAWITVSESFKIKELLKNMIHRLFKEVKQLVPEGVETMDWNSLKGIINAFLRLKNPYLPKSPGPCFAKRRLRRTSPSHLEGLLTSILRRCKGLPLAMVAICGLLSAKDKSSVAKWEKTYQSLGAELEGNNQLLSMKKILSLSYINLPHYLKLFFLYLSVFPEDHLIEHWRLSWLWIAEGFVEEKREAPIEQVAEGYLNELINRSLIQVAKINGKRRIKLYRIHDLWHEIIVFKSREQNIVTIASEQGMRWPERVRRLSIHDNI
ncbi:hypothetical protein TEA_007262 [Camellia sinensis var. sinensis]|uniref:Phytochrome chromophore attachment site domain-containing protein n=1 Tax=Camellia sinensis var. sinensis TaxID=542762 RepID=A0A4S4EUK8_CAMSN|nr:hypothetical protein TEA_007262 [Camellia sinensis var. sinensis]